MRRSASKLLADAGYAGGALQDLARYFARILTEKDCEQIVRRSLQTRESQFLLVAKHLIYETSWSPYLRLLNAAGCEYRDLELMVSQRGLEDTLRQLARAGVCLSFEEFRGRTDVVRGSNSFRFRFQDFDNPRGRKLLQERTGGTRSVGLPVSMSLGDVAARTASFGYALHAPDARDKVPITWHTGMRIPHWLTFAKLGSPPERWFSLRDPQDPTSGPRALTFVQMARLVALLRGLRLPAPEYATFEAARSVLRAVVQAAEKKSGCLMSTTPSLAVRLAGLAREQGISLERVTFLVRSEPLTPGKAAEIRATGARVGSLYAFSEGGGVVAIPCSHPQEADDMHFLTDCFGIIHRDREYAGAQVQSYMFTTLLGTAPKIMLNVEMDDFGVLERRRCGCPVERVGYDVHIANVRSFTKLTGEGMTVLGTNCVQIIEEVLPAAFGGESVDYQLLEAEDEQRLTRLFLLVSPRLGDIDENSVRQRFISALEQADWREGMPDLWRSATTIQVLRKEPVPTKSGKLFPFHTIALNTVHQDRPAEAVKR